MADTNQLGFVRDATTGALTVVTSTVGATVQRGFLRDTSGRLVVKYV